MGNKYTRIVSTPAHQRQPLPGREAEMEKNNAGGYTFKLDKWKMLERFLILGAEGGTYYVNQDRHAANNIKSLQACIDADPARVANEAINISVNGRAFKNDPVELAIAALIAKGGLARQFGWAAMPAIIRTGRTLLEFSQLLDSMGVKWPMSRRTAFANWYNTRNADQLAYQTLKYPSSSGWTHKDLLRLCHAKGGFPDHAALFRYIVGKPGELMQLPTLVQGWEAIKKVTTVKEAVALVQEYELTWEFVPGQFQGEPLIWTALLPNLPYTALIRNLGRMTAYGLFNGMNSNVKFVRDKLTSRDGLRKARVHPMTLLIAKKTYDEGVSVGASKGRSNALAWSANQNLSSALEDAFYLSFDTIEPSGKDMMFAIDVSGSMSNKMSNLPISCAEAAAVMAMVSLKQEKNSFAVGFAHQIKDLKISKNDALDAVLKKTRDNNFGSTDCAAAILYALQNGIEVDQIVMITDGETWSGSMHPVTALNKYREKVGRATKMIVEGMTSTGFTIADPADEGMLDVVGFDTSVPMLVSKFVQGL